jgi:hypothetical protein
MPMLMASKRMRYATRRLLPGDVFEASNRDARLLVALKKASVHYAPAYQPPPPAAAPAVAHEADELKAARAEYEAAIGRKPFHGWGVEQLRAKIAEARAGDDA